MSELVETKTINNNSEKVIAALTPEETLSLLKEIDERVQEGVERRAKQLEAVQEARDAEREAQYKLREKELTAKHEEGMRGLDVKYNEAKAFYEADMKDARSEFNKEIKEMRSVLNESETKFRKLKASRAEKFDAEKNVACKRDFRDYLMSLRKESSGWNTNSKIRMIDDILACLEDHFGF